MYLISWKQKIAKVLDSFVEVLHVPYKLETEDCESFR